MAAILFAYLSQCIYVYISLHHHSPAETHARYTSITIRFFLVAQGWDHRIGTGNQPIKMVNRMIIMGPNLTHYGPVVSHSHMNLCQHRVWWWFVAMTWTIVDSKLLASIPVQSHRKYARYADRNYQWRFFSIRYLPGDNEFKVGMYNKCHKTYMVLLGFVLVWWYHQFLTLKLLDICFSKCVYLLLLFTLNVTFLHEIRPMQGIFIKHCGY